MVPSRFAILPISPRHPHMGVNSGAVYVHYGSSTGVHTTPDTSLTGAASGSFGNITVAIADLNGDGFGRLIATGGGKILVFVSTGSTGIPSGADTTASISIPNAGSILVVGDVNGDGNADIADTVVGTTPSATVYLGSSAGGPAGSVSTTPATTIAGASNTGFGSSVALIDTKGEGTADLVVGSDQAHWRRSF